jgi:hypothetical protein
VKASNTLFHSFFFAQNFQKIFHYLSTAKHLPYFKMRQFIPNVALVSILSILVLQTNGRPTTCIPARYAQGIEDRSIDGTKICAVDSTELIEGLAIERRASGGRPGDKTPDVPGRVPDSNGPGDGGPTDSTGGGGMGRPGGTTGGMGDRPDEGGQQYAPSARNNQNQPATSDQRFDPATKNLAAIDIVALKNDMINMMKEKQLEGGPWYFYSGLEDKNIFFNNVRPILSRKLGLKDGENDKLIPSMEDLKRKFEEDANALNFEAGDFSEYFWNAYSKAYAQAISGKAYVVIPEDMPLNQPFQKNYGSAWWSFEVPELTRNAGIEEIRLVRLDPTPNMDYADGGVEMFDLIGDQLIWKRGDEPLGFPADEQYKAAKPGEAFNL